MTLLDSSPRPEILIVAPPPLTPTDEPFFAALFNDAIEESKLFAHWYSDLAAKKGVHFFDAGQVCETSPLDAVHMDAENTRALGEALAPVVRRVLEGVNG